MNFIGISQESVQFHRKNTGIGKISRVPPSAWTSVSAGYCPFITLDKKFKAATRGLQS
jgi:hypothetical protein